MPDSDLHKRLEQMELLLSQKDDYIRELETVNEAYEHLKDFSSQELRDAHMMIQAHESLQQLSRKEKIDKEEVIQAREMAGSLADLEMMRHDMTLRLFLKMNRAISSILHLEALNNKILETSVKALSAQRGILMFREGDDFLPFSVIGMKMSQLEESCFSYSNSVIHDVLNDKKSRLINKNLMCGGSKKKLSLLCVPIVYENVVYGVLYLDVVSDSNIFHRHDMEVLEVFASQGAIAIENAYLYQNLEEKVLERTQELNDALGVIRSDLMLARRIQRKILPKDIEKISKNLNFDLYYNPMSEVGGDIYDISVTRDGRIRIFLADATGHGVQAAFVTMLIKAEYERFKKYASKPDELLELLNHEFFNEYKSLVVFFTCIVVDIDIKERKMICASAGHPDQFLIHEKELILIPSTGKITGAVADAQYWNLVYDFLPDSKLVLFTDGLTEEFDFDKQEYGEERAEKIVRDVLSANENILVKDIISAVSDDMRDFIGDENLNDDITILGIEWKED